MEILLIDNGSGSFVTNHYFIGKSTYITEGMTYAATDHLCSGAPQTVPSVVSRLVTAEYWQRQCALFFPPEDGYTYGSANGKTAADVNEWTKGWFLSNTTRLIWTNGYP